MGMCLQAGFMWSWWLNPGLHACYAGILPTGLSSALSLDIFEVCLDCLSLYICVLLQFSFSRIHLHLFYVFGFHLHVCICTTSVPDVSTGQKRVSNSLEVELEILMSCHTGSGDRALVFCSSHCWATFQPHPLPLSDLELTRLPLFYIDPCLCLSSVMSSSG